MNNLFSNNTPNSYLFFDTETTGLPKSYSAPASQLNNWPRLVQLAWLSYDKDGNKLKEASQIVKPEGFIIPIEASNIHGITTERATRDGVPLRGVLEQFRDVVNNSDCLVAHNMSYDIKIVHSELLRNNLPCDIESKMTICTKEKSTNYCAINGQYGYKWPKLPELYKKLFNTELRDAHDALVDIQATAACFWELRKRGIL